jgi:hypothetical protein
MRELRIEETGDRCVALIETDTERYNVTIAVRGPEGAWEDIRTAGSAPGVAV